MMRQAIFFCLFAGALVTTVRSHSCLEAYQECYPDSKSIAIKEMNVLDPIPFNLVCGLYREVNDCFKGAKNSHQDCDEDKTKIDALTTTLGQDVHEMCNADGTVSQCTMELTACMGAVTTALTYMNDKSINGACAYRNMFQSCQKKAMTMTSCTELQKSMLQSFGEQIDTSDFTTNCDSSECIKGIGKCLNDLSLDITQQPYPTKMCPDYKEALACTDQLKQKECKADTTNAIEQSLVVYEMPDYCNADGTASACQTTTSQCKFNPVEVNKLPVDQRCQQINVYLDCLTKAGCSRKYVEKVFTPLKTELINDEIYENCSRLGTCQDQLEGCTFSLKYAIAHSADLETTCSYAKNAQPCACRVEQSLVCGKDQKIIEALKKVDAQKYDLVNKCKDTKSPVSAECSDGSGAPTVSASIFLVLATLLLTHFRFW